MKTQPIAPGSIAKKAGIYGLVGPRGGLQGPQVTIPKGHRVPPTPKPGQQFILVDATKTKKH